MLNINTLYRIKNRRGVYTLDAVREFTTSEVKPLGFYVGDTINVHQADGTIKVAYMYGEKTYSYSKQERDDYRVKMNEIRAKTRERKELLTKILNYYNEMSIEQLRGVVESLWTQR